MIAFNFFKSYLSYKTHMEGWVKLMWPVDEMDMAPFCGPTWCWGKALWYEVGTMWGVRLTARGWGYSCSWGKVLSTNNMVGLVTYTHIMSSIWYAALMARLHLRPLCFHCIGSARVVCTSVLMVLSDWIMGWNDQWWFWSVFIRLTPILIEGMRAHLW